MWKNFFVATMLIITTLLAGRGQVVATIGQSCLKDADCSNYPNEACLPNGRGTTDCQLTRTVCQYVSNDPNDQKRKDCDDCVNVKKGTWTAVGCVETDSSVFVQKLLGLGIGIAGGIAFLLILFGGFQILISAGNPEKMNAGKEIISSAIAGLLLIVFSVFLLKLIGYDILRIPGFRP